MLPSDLLIREGWIRWAHSTEEGRCLVGAIAQATPGTQIVVLLDDMSIELARQVSVIVGDDIAFWNDNRCPDVSTAIAVMRQAEINCGLRPVGMSNPRASRHADPRKFCEN